MPHFKVDVSAILDTLEKLYPDAQCALHHHNAFELLIATILSAQCTDKMVNELTPALFAKYPSADALSIADVSDVEVMIAKCGLYRTKARNIVKTSQLIVEQHNGQVPATRELLMGLPGVGRKTANVVLSTVFHVPAIAVDTHVQRVANRLGLAQSDDVAVTEQQLMKRIPRSLWSQAHHWLIYHGRLVCHARSPKCSSCALSSLCRYNRTQQAVS